MEERESRTRFKLVHVVMPHQWLKHIKKSYRRKRAVRGDGDADSATTSSCETSFESSSLFRPHLGPSDAARSLIDVAFPLSPKALRLIAYSKQLSPSVAMSPLRYTVSPSPASGSSPPSRFYPSPCRYPPSPTRKMLFPTRGIDISYPISPRKPSVVVSIQTPSPATRFLTGVRTVKNVEQLPPLPSPPRFSTASAPDRSDYNKAPQSTALLQRSRSARSSLFACFTDDFRLPESATKVEDKEAVPSYLPRLGGSARGAARDFHNQVVPLSPSDHVGIMQTEQKQQHHKVAESGGGGRGKNCTCAPGGSDYCAACSSRESAAVTSGRAGNLLSKSARHSGAGSSSRREARAGRGSSTHHRRVLSLSCISNAARNSPDGQEMLASASLSSSLRRADIGEQASQAAAPAVKPAPSPAAAAGEWRRETSWNVLAELDNEVVRRRVVLRKRVQSVSHGVQLQQNVMYDPEASSFGFRSPSLEELQGASQKRLADTGFVDGVDTCGSFRLSTSSVDVNAEHNVVPWDKDFSSATSEDPESLFTPFEVDSACVTPGATSSSSATGFGNSIKASRLAAVSNANPHADRSPSAAWTVPFIPEECEVACPSPEDSDVEPAEEADEQSCRVSDESGQASDVAEVDSEEEEEYGSLRSSARSDTKSCSSSSRQGDGALTEDEHDDGDDDDDDDVGGDDEEEDEDESGGQSWDEMEAWPPSPVVEEDEYEDEDEDELKEGEEWNASCSMQEAWPELRFRCRDAGEQMCDDNQSEMDCSSSIDDACAMEQAQQQQCDESESKGGGAAAAAGPGRWTDGLQSLVDGRLFPSSEDEMAVLNKPDSNEGQLQVSDESCDERDWQCRGSDTPERREASPHPRRKTARDKTKHVSGTPRAMSMAVDRKPAADPARRSEEIARRKAKLAEGRRESFVHAVDLPAEIRGRVRESVPVVTHSYDPYTDFRDSMVEMILEKDILDSQDLEDLLHAYLALNRGEFHGLIVEVFTDLWYEIFDAEESQS